MQPAKRWSGVGLQLPDKDSPVEGGSLRLHCTVSFIALQDAMIIGADYYESEDQRSALLAAGRIPIGIGQGSVISNTIVDKNARIGQNCTIVNKEGIEEAVREDEGLYIRSGIVCVLRNAEIPNGTQV